MQSLYYDYDLVGGKTIRKKVVSSLVPIYEGLISGHDSKEFVKWITHSRFCGENSYCHMPTLPSTDLKAPHFRPATYWRGPIWINMNWFIWFGLIRYGYHYEAELIRQGVFELTSNHGFREYYDPYTGEGIGGIDSSWTAAPVIDMIENSRIGVTPD